MKIKELVSYLNDFAPLSLQESYDNSGLQVGDPSREVERALICIDCTEEVLKEAVDNKCDLIISHHPLIFGGLDRLTGDTEVQRIVSEAIRQVIAIYSIHTNLDNVIDGVNGKLAEVLEIKPERVLRPMADQLMKLAVHVPSEALESVRSALFSAGAGVIGNYSECSFTFNGQGTFKPLNGADPTIGSIGVRHEAYEEKLEVILFKWRVSKALQAMLSAHPYEEVAYDILPLQNHHNGLGSGLIGSLEAPMSENDFLLHIKDRLGAQVLRHSQLLGKPIMKVAICGGSGSFLIKDAKASGVDAFITADVKYHQFQEPDGQLLLVDAGHYETERSTMQLLREILEEKFPKFALRLTDTVSNPIHYA